MLLKLIIILIVAKLLQLLIKKLYTKNEHHYFRRIPIVSKVPYIGGMLTMINFTPDNLHLKFGEFVARFGKSFYANFWNEWLVVTCDVRYVEDLLTSSNHIHKSDLYYVLRPWLGNGLLLSHSQQWQTMRKIITPAFHFKILEQFMQIFNEQSKVLVQKLATYADGKTVVDIHPFIGLVTLDIIAETAMGQCINAQSDTECKFVQAVHDVTNISAERFMQPILVHPTMFKLLKPQMHRQAMEGIAIMHNFTQQIIAKRRETRKTRATVESDNVNDIDCGLSKKRLAFLDVLLEAQIDEQPLSDRQLRDEVNTFMFEGHDTTTSAISFCLYLLSRNTDCQQKLFEELKTYFGTSSLQKSIEMSDLQSLPYLSCVVKESLRLFPPVPAIGRGLHSDLQLVDEVLPPRCNIIVMLWQMFRDPEIFAEPEQFRPERHIENIDSAARVGSNFCYIPFSAGPRNCIGQRFALLEMKTVLIHLISAYELLPIGEPVQPSIRIVLRSKNGVQFGLRRRQSK